jgi:hypothetical protein
MKLTKSRNYYLNYAIEPNSYLTQAREEEKERRGREREREREKS